MTTLEPPPEPIRDLERSLQVLATDGTRTGLIGSRCTRCSLAAFPSRDVCSGCGSHDLATADLGSRGTLYTYAAVHVASGRPTPYILGYVDLLSGPRVLARITVEEEALEVGQDVELHVDESGWAFRPDPPGGPRA